MLLGVRHLSSYRIHASDGDIGKVHDFLFDDRSREVRYLVVDTGHWLPGRRVLIAPAAFRQPEPGEKRFNLSLSSEQVENSPEMDVEKPISRQKQIELHEHYGWPPYWPPGGFYDVPPPAPTVPGGEEAAERPEAREAEGDPHLRSCRELADYTVFGSDGEAGEVHDFIIDTEKWAVGYLVVDTRRWLPGGRKLPVPAAFMEEISWESRAVRCGLSREKIRAAPELDASGPVDSKFEESLRQYYSE